MSFERDLYVSRALSSDVHVYEECMDMTKLLEPKVHRRTSNSAKFLVCHDMRGNYRTDVFNQGSMYSHDAFQIFQWDICDIFCYFSHKFISIPPLQWVNACRRHGVQVMGTLITEWAAGQRTCQRQLGSNKAADALAARLVKISKLNGIEGWLINIENELSENGVNVMLYFLEKLTKLMHEHIPGSTVLWYDAVTIHGKLTWQNTLNAENKLFFDKCDGIFLNYAWKEDTPAEAAAVAGPGREKDVYFGIDCFGRGMISIAPTNACYYPEQALVCCIY